MLAAQEDQVDTAAEEDVDSAAALVAQVPVPAAEAALRWLAVLARVTAAPVVLAQPMAVLVVALAAEALVELLNRQSFSAAMARSTT
jgi:hypothetical protein